MDAHWAGMMGQTHRKVRPPHRANPSPRSRSTAGKSATQNWTPKFREEFLKRRGYDPVRFLPVFAGQTVDSTEATERFPLGLPARTIADMFAENYVGHMQRIGQ